jgi:hypothetical protein
LYEDLKLHDAEEGKLKALLVDNGDPEGERAAAVRKAFFGKYTCSTCSTCSSKLGRRFIKWRHGLYSTIILA